MNSVEKIENLIRNQSPLTYGLALSSTIFSYYLLRPTIKRLLWKPTKSLQGKVVLVTGASRGVGKGIAIGLGEAGATVYVTGRTLHAQDSRLPGTINDTAALVSEAGGVGIAVQCDSANDQELEALIQRIVEEQGRLDVVVNNAFQIPPQYEGKFTAKAMIPRHSGLIVNISSAGAERYLFYVAYGVGKIAVDRMAKDMDHELRREGVGAISLHPGMVKTERIMENSEDFLKKYQLDIESIGETGVYSGRAIAAFASDPNYLKKTGRVYTTKALAVAYGVTDVDGRQPHAMFSFGFYWDAFVAATKYKLFGKAKK